jgi:succinate dehydrogenase/fumarate reductase cytochrome b subunit
VGRVAKVQALSGLCFALFLALHLATTVSAAGGPGSYDGTLASLRAIYRAHPIVEFLLVGVSAAVHIACAVIQFNRRRKTGPHPKPGLRLRLHRWSGYFLMLVIVGHVFATRVMPAQSASGPADFAYLGYSVLSWPAMINPYYYALGTAGAVHFGLGLGFAVSALLPGRDPRRLSMAVAAVVAVLVIAGVTGIIGNAEKADPSRFSEFRALYGRYMPFMPTGK